MVPLPSAILVLSLVGLAPAAPGVSPDGADAPTRTIDVTAHRFEFSPSKISLEKGETVKLRLTSTDVVHGFFQRALKIDELIEVGKITDVTLTPRTAGTFTVICHHFCGVHHASMKMTIVVTE